MNATTLLWSLAMLGILALASQASTPQPSLKAEQKRMLAIIDAAAAKYGVPVSVARAFAWLESELHPDRIGDRNWAKLDGGARYKRYVLEAARFAKNPFRTQPALWCSYGLFQLNAAHFAGDNEDPRKLLDPTINADRACRYIRSCLDRAWGDVHWARVLYAGAAKLDKAKQTKVTSRLDAALRRFA